MRKRDKEAIFNIVLGSFMFIGMLISYEVYSTILFGISSVYLIEKGVDVL